ASKGEAKRWFAMGDGRDAPGGVRERLRSPRLALTATGIAGRRKISIRTRLVPCVTIPRRRAAPDETASPSPTDEWTAIGDAKSDRASESDRPSVVQIRDMNERAERKRRTSGGQ